jgi:hypothetical protein
MENRIRVNSLADLRHEKQRLRLLAREQEGYLADQYELLRHKVAAPARAFNTIASYIPGVGALQALFTAKPGTNNSIGAKIVNVLVPLLANRFLPRKTGLMARGLFSFLTKQATALLTNGKLSETIDQITAVLQRKPASKPAHPFGKRKRPKEADYGIPPDSETY